MSASGNTGMSEQDRQRALSFDISVPKEVSEEMRALWELTDRFIQQELEKRKIATSASV